MKMSAFENQGVIDNPRDAERTIRPTVETEVDLFLTAIMAEWARVILAQHKEGEIDTRQMRESVNRVSENKFKRTMIGLVTEAFGLGRNAEIAKNADITNRIIRSEVLDTNTCPPCLRADGRTFRGVNDPEFAPFARGPFAKCEGGDACRGINIVEIT